VVHAASHYLFARLPADARGYSPKNDKTVFCASRTKLASPTVEGAVVATENNIRRIQVRWLGDYRTEIDVRGVHKITGDELSQYGVQDAGPMPTELLLAGIASCMCLAVHHVAKKRRVTLNQIRVSAEGEKDMNAFRFHLIELLVEADLRQEELEALVERSRKYCFVSNTLIHGCEIQTRAQSIEAAE
jgi:uncharacterized OsmC-like protein